MSREGTRKHGQCIQLTIIHCCSNFCYLVTFTALLNCWLILTPCCKTRRKMLGFDRPRIFPLILVFSILQSTIQPRGPWPLAYSLYSDPFASANFVFSSCCI